MKTKYSVVIALGGNALSPKGDNGNIENQFLHTRESMKNIMYFIRKNYNICITHGNGPQVGDELRRHEIASKKIPPLPLGVLVANTQGAIGYMIQQSLQNALYKEKSEREVVTFISQVKVNRDDINIKKPSKYVGFRFNSKKAKLLSEKYNWNIKEQESNNWRRIVPSPTPLYIFNGKSIKHLVDFGTIVIAGGGGGIPAFNHKNGKLDGLDAVIDKDMTAALMGRVTKSRELFIITDVDNIYINYLKTNQQTINKITDTKLKNYLKDGHFQEGTMAPKIRAALYFLKYHGEKVVITSISNLKNSILNNSGTIIRKNK